MYSGWSLVFWTITPNIDFFALKKKRKSCILIIHIHTHLVFSKTPTKYSILAFVTLLLIVIFGL